VLAVARRVTVIRMNEFVSCDSEKGGNIVDPLWIVRKPEFRTTAAALMALEQVPFGLIANNGWH